MENTNMAADENYTCTLDKHSLKKAKEELHENPEDRLAAVQALRDWINEQPHIKCPQTDAKFLLRFLRWAKFSQIRARHKLQCYLNFRTTIPSVYANIDTTEKIILDILDAGYFYALPKNHPDGNPVLILQTAILSQFSCSMASHLRSATTVMEYMQSKEINQVHGYLLFIDFTGANLRGISKLFNIDTALVMKEMMKCATGRIQAIHLYQPAVFIEMALTIFKKVMPRKLFERITVHGTMESVYRYIPKQCLPIEYLPDDYTGPSAGTVEQCTNEIKKGILDAEFHDTLLYWTSKEFSVDTLNKPQNVVLSHYRKLSVD